MGRAGARQQGGGRRSRPGRASSRDLLRRATRARAEGKIHAAFRERLLRRTLDAQRVLCSMVLFRCTVCNERFPTWHPGFRPEFELDCLRDCFVAADFDEASRDPPVGALHAPVCSGTCARCRRSEAKVAADPLLHGIVAFSSANDWDPLFGLDKAKAFGE